MVSLNTDGEYCKSVMGLSSMHSCSLATECVISESENKLHIQLSIILYYASITFDMKHSPQWHIQKLCYQCFAIYINIKCEKLFLQASLKIKQQLHQKYCKNPKH